MSQHEIQQHTLRELPDPLAPAGVPRLHPQPPPHPEPSDRRWLRPHRTWQQVLGGLILAAACATAAAWYVPRVLSTDGRLLTGSVVTSGVATLNFTSSGEIARIAVHQGQRVHKGQLLATEYAPDVAIVLSADRTAISAEKSKLVSMTAAVSNSTATHPDQVAPTPADLAAVRAQLKLDEAQLAADRARGAASQIVAPARGTVVAANGRPGEVVTSQGIRDYATDGPRAPINQAPAFSLLPEGPQAESRVSASASALPVIALRTSSSWQVAAIVPQSTISKITVGQHVFISVPAAHITALRERISEVLPDPVSTAEGTEYQVLITVPGHVDASPLSGMAADVRLAAPEPTPSHR
jgi:multidrug efflux pump subunit AcrA (membrane-fusion protein)